MLRKHSTAPSSGRSQPSPRRRAKDRVANLGRAGDARRAARATRRRRATGLLLGVSADEIGASVAFGRADDPGRSRRRKHGDDQQRHQADDRGRRQRRRAPQLPRLGDGTPRQPAASDGPEEADRGDQQDEGRQARLDVAEVARARELREVRAPLDEQERGEPRREEEPLHRHAPNRARDAGDGEELEQADAPEDLLEVTELVLQVVEVERHVVRRARPRPGRPPPRASRRTPR